jgi:hypothetical protein
MCIPECTVKQGCYNFPYKKTGKYCSKHALEGMINVRIKKCELYDICKTAATYNYPGIKPPIRCSYHKKDGMRDVVHPQCQFIEGCELNAQYNYINVKGRIYCKNHALDGMVCKDARMCKFIGCKIGASFCPPNSTDRTFCAAHAPDDYVDTCSTFCKNCKDTQVYCHANDGYCFKCYNELHPDKPNPRQHKVRENAVVENVKTYYPNVIVDEKVAGGKSQKRPDMLIDLSTHVIIIEVDEDQHRRYEKGSDESRIKILQEDIKKLVVMIRFNPDFYKNSKNVGIKSCWKKVFEIMTIVDRVNWNARLARLQEVVTHYINNIPTENCLVKLFFHNHDDESHNNPLNVIHDVVDSSINEFDGEKIIDYNNLPMLMENLQIDENNNNNNCNITL